MVFLLGLYMLVIINSAWLSDDSFISLSQIVNLHNGDGLVFNFGERVQAFTHPTWFFLLAFITWITGNYYYTIIFTSIAASTAAIYIIFRYAFLKNNSAAAMIGMSVLLFSKAFIDFTTSGLENPLSYLLFALIMYVLEMKNIQTTQSLMFIYITMAFLFLNRMDYALILLPIVVHLIVRYRSENSIPILTSAILVSAWFLFSLFYFGHIFPNAFYAKLMAGYPEGEYLQRGFQYFQVQYGKDPITLLIIFVGIFLGIFQNGVLRASSIGIVLYLLFFLRSGGDFMQGRFFAVPAFMATFLMVAYLTRRRVSVPVILLAAIAISGGASSSSPLFTGKEYSDRDLYFGVADERGVVFQASGLVSSSRSWPEIVTLKQTQPKEVGVICGGLGGAGLSRRNDVYFIDYCALADPLLSQLPAIGNRDWRIGHQYRHVPVNYEDAVLDSNVALLDSNLNDLYSDMRLVTRGRLLDKERLTAILRINFHNYYIDETTYKSLNMLPGARKIWN